MKKRTKKSSASKSDRLKILATEINEAYSEVETMIAAAQKQGADALKLAVDCGKALIQAKQATGHGGWMLWLAKNCKKVHPRTAQNYMRLASNTKALSYLTTPKTLLKAYIQVGIIPETAPVRKQLAAPKQPPILEAVIVEEKPKKKGAKSQTVPAQQEASVPGGESSKNTIESVSVRPAAPEAGSVLPPVSRDENAAVAAPASSEKGAVAGLAPANIGILHSGDIKTVAASLKQPGQPRGGLVAEKRAAEAVQKSGRSVTVAELLAALEDLKTRTSASVAYGPEPKWHQYHGRVIEMIQGL